MYESRQQQVNILRYCSGRGGDIMKYIMVEQVDFMWVLILIIMD